MTDTGTQATRFMDAANQNRNGIWWLASYPKSGNTWIRMCVNCAVTRFPANINAAYQYACGDNAAQWIQSTSSVPLGDMGMREAIYLRPASLINRLAVDSPRDVCLKTHHANLACDEIPLIPPKLSKGAVYMIRDPRDVVVSFAKHMGITIDRAIDLMETSNTIIHHQHNPIFHYLSDWSTHVRSWLDEANPVPTSCVRYEDMLAKPHATFGQIVGALGLDHVIDLEAIDFAIEQTRFDRIKQQESERGFRERGRKQGEFFNHGKAGMWREVLTAEQAGRIETCHGAVMDELGYHVSETIGV